MKFEIKHPEYVNRTYRIPKELADRLSQIAQQENISVNELVVQSCQFALENLKKKVNNLPSLFLKFNFIFSAISCGYFISNLLFFLRLNTSLLKEIPLFLFPYNATLLPDKTFHCIENGCVSLHIRLLYHPKITTDTAEFK